MNRRTLLFLIAALPGVALAQEKLSQSGPSEGQLSRPEATRLEKRRGARPDPANDESLRLQERFLSPLLPFRPAPGANSLGSYLAGPSYPRAFEAVAEHLILREAERHWRRIAKKGLKDLYASDPSYDPRELEEDMARLREVWGLRKLPSFPRLDLGSSWPARRSPSRERNLLENRFFTLDQDLRLRLDFKEVVGIAIGEGPEDDYKFQAATYGSPLPSQRRRTRLPRIQLRGRAKLHIDQKALMGLDASEGYFDRYGGEISVAFISREASRKVLTASLEITRSERDGTEFSFAFKKKF